MVQERKEDNFRLEVDWRKIGRLVINKIREASIGVLPEVYMLLRDDTSSARTYVRTWDISLRSLLLSFTDPGTIDTH